jgi:hypothetical protein
MLNIISYELDPTIRIPPEAAEAGTREGWKAAIEAAVTVEDCPHWTLGAASAYVGPVLPLSGFETCGINFSGPSSRGKTTAVALGVSAWTSPRLTSGGLLRSMRTTENAIELSPRQSNHTILGLDELAHVDGTTVGRTIYFLPGGVSKARMSRDLMARPTHNWTTFVLLSSEKSLAQKDVGDGGQWTGGMAVRFPDVDCGEVDANVPRDTLAKLSRHLSPLWAGRPVLHRPPGGRVPPRARKAAQPHPCRRREPRGRGHRRCKAARRATIRSDRRRGRTGAEIRLPARERQYRRSSQLGLGAICQFAGGAGTQPHQPGPRQSRRWMAEHWDVAIKHIDTPYKTSRDAIGWYDDNATTSRLPGSGKRSRVC